MTGKRDSWVAMLKKIGDPVLKNAAAGNTPGQYAGGAEAGCGRENFTHLERWEGSCAEWRLGWKQRIRKREAGKG